MIDSTTCTTIMSGENATSRYHRDCHHVSKRRRTLGSRRKDDVDHETPHSSLVEEGVAVTTPISTMTLEESKRNEHRRIQQVVNLYREKKIRHAPFYWTISVRETVKKTWPRMGDIIDRRNQRKTAILMIPDSQYVFNNGRVIPSTVSNLGLETEVQPRQLSFVDSDTPIVSSTSSPHQTYQSVSSGQIRDENIDSKYYIEHEYNSALVNCIAFVLFCSGKRSHIKFQTQATLVNALRSVLQVGYYLWNCFRQGELMVHMCNSVVDILNNRLWPQKRYIHTEQMTNVTFGNDALEFNKLVDDYARLVGRLVSSQILSAPLMHTSKPIDQNTIPLSLIWQGGRNSFVDMVTDSIADILEKTRESINTYTLPSILKSPLFTCMIHDSPGRPPKPVTNVLDVEECEVEPITFLASVLKRVRFIKSVHRSIEELCTGSTVNVMNTHRWSTDNRRIIELMVNLEETLVNNRINQTCDEKTWITIVCHDVLVKPNGGLYEHYYCLVTNTERSIDDIYDIFSISYFSNVSLATEESHHKSGSATTRSVSIVSELNITKCTKIVGESSFVTIVDFPNNVIGTITRKKGAYLRMFRLSSPNKRFVDAVLIWIYSIALHVTSLHDREFCTTSDNSEYDVYTIDNHALLKNYGYRSQLKANSDRPDSRLSKDFRHILSFGDSELPKLQVLDKRFVYPISLFELVDAMDLLLETRTSSVTLNKMVREESGTIPRNSRVQCCIVTLSNTCSYVIGTMDYSVSGDQSLPRTDEPARESSSRAAQRVYFIFDSVPLSSEKSVFASTTDRATYLEMLVAYRQLGQHSSPIVSLVNTTSYTNVHFSSILSRIKNQR